MPTRVRQAAQSVLAGWLAFLLLGFTLIASSGPLHEAFHHDSAAGAGACAICLFAQGHIDSPDAAPPLVLGVFLLFCGLLAVRAGVPRSVDFLLPPGRAPPCFSSAS
jgi:hypothetical protein